MNKKILISCLLVLPFWLMSQEIKNEFIIEYSGHSFPQLMQDLTKSISSRNNTLIRHIPFSNQSTNIYHHIIVDTNYENEWYSMLTKQKEIKHIEYNTEVESRYTKPNDPRINEQWYLENIKAFDAWSITQGGNDPDGKEIVIAVIDDGFFTNHEDFADIFYINHAEIPNDGLDNDGNGYVDDYTGYNVDLGNGNITSERHGTNVLGVLGARGNNGIGISGINWNVKVLPIVIPPNSPGVEKALNYILAMKNLYNISNGAKGANIVVATYSGGIQKRFPDSFPIWCELYNKLGQVGILSIGATTNADENVDVVGDMPSTCLSEYLIVVTNSNKNDVKAKDAGYGKQHVDLAVPGEQILTTTNSVNKYSVEYGTSLSAPILAGAVSLLFTADCGAFQQLYKNNPPEAVIALKNIILDSGDNAFYTKSGQNAPLSEVTVSGKRLNILSALDSMRVRFDNCIKALIPKGPLTLGDIIILNETAYIEYRTSSEEDIDVVVFDALGKVIYRTSFIPMSDENHTYPLDLNLTVNKGSTALDSQVFVLFVAFSQGKDKVGKSFYHFR